MLTANVTTIAFQQSELHSALTRVRHAISKEATRYYLNGVYVHATKEGVHFVATDGHRMARVTVPSDNDHSAMCPVILPADCVAAIIKATAKRSHRNLYATLQVELGKIRFCPANAETTDDTIEAVPVDETFPDYLRVVPAGDPKNGVIAIPAEQFGQAVKAIHDYRNSNESGNGVAVRLAIGADSVTVSGTPCETRPELGKSPEFSGASAKVHDCCISGDAPALSTMIPDVAFNGRYLADIVKAADGPVLQFHYFDHGGPALFRAAGDQFAYFVLMPMRI